MLLIIPLPIRKIFKLYQSHMISFWELVDLISIYKIIHIYKISSLCYLTFYNK